jgi:VWFA-related protein
MKRICSPPWKTRISLRFFALPTLVFAACIAGISIRAQQEPKQETKQETKQERGPDSQQPPKIEVNVKTVSVVAVVRDKHGKIVPDLGQDAFALEEDGRPQTINYFAKESDLPLRLGLLVDTSMSQRRVIEQERTASYSFVDHMLREHKDLAAVINFDHDVTLLQDFTDSRPKLQAALESLEVSAPSARGGSSEGNSGGSSGRGGGNGGGGGGYGRGGGHGGHRAGTLLYDAVYLASDELMSKQQGRKALIILTDGEDHGSKETLAEAIETAQRADTVIYTILFKDEEGYGNYGGYGGRHGMGGGMGGPQRRPPQEEHVDGKKILEEISKKSGGRMFQVSKKETVEKIYAEIEEELRNQYRFGYTPDKGAEPGYHKIELTTHNKDLIVQAREGYYGGQ